MNVRSILFAASVGTMVLGACQPQQPPSRQQAPRYEAAPDFSLTDVDGQPIKLSEASRERPQLVLFWATWCPYCRALLPHIQSIVMEYQGAIGVLAVNIKEDGDPAAYLDEAGVDVTLLPEGDEVAELYGVKGTPGLFLVATDGTIRFDLSQLPALPESADGEKPSHRMRARRLAPCWASELRKAIDGIGLDE